MIRWHDLQEKAVHWFVNVSSICLICLKCVYCSSFVDVPCSRASKGFSNQQTMKQCGCVEPFTETLQVFLTALRTPVHRNLLHSGVRQYLHRMVVCLEGEILPFVPLAMESLLHNPDAKELHDFIPLINQVVSKFKVTRTAWSLMKLACALSVWFVCLLGFNVPFRHLRSYHDCACL